MNQVVVDLYEVRNVLMCTWCLVACYKMRHLMSSGIKTKRYNYWNVLWLCGLRWLLSWTWFNSYIGSFACSVKV